MRVENNPFSIYIYIYIYNNFFFFCAKFINIISKLQGTYKIIKNVMTPLSLTLALTCQCWQMTMV